MELRVGVLVIGSLLWDNERQRPDWRDARLRMAEAQPVRVPIRYGRRSRKRSNNYTMVFSTLCYRHKEPGRGWVVPLARVVNSFDGLLTDANALAEAEGLNAWTWGAVALLRNNQRKYPPGLIRDWQRYFTEKSANCRVFEAHARSEWPALGRSGVLRIKWPVPEDGQPLKLDLLLATPTEANLVQRGVRKRYPSPKEIGNTYARTGDPSYFIQNIRHGIFTSADKNIWRAMLRVRPQWAAEHADIAMRLGDL
jgi:hypothetical protein